ncbi:MAG TPA: SDR family oxidoreductase [Steroidobacteraceae bacterium]|nr:SDR family oxidoreductase [Steroidobacteraceae bacterium]
MSIVITGASGAYGRMAAERLLSRIDPSQLVLVTRSPAALASFAARGATVRFGDFDQPESLRAAFAGAQKLLLISTLDVGARRRRQHRTAIDAAVAGGVEHVIYTSSVGIHPHSPAFVIEDHLFTEEALRASGLKFTFLRDAQYAEVITTMIAPPAIASGEWVSSAGDGCMAFVSKKDCVDSAVAVLTTPNHEGAVYEITGPELLSFADCARIAAEVTGKPIRFVNVSHEAMQARFDAAGVPRRHIEGTLHQAAGAWGSEEMMSYERGIREGYFAVASHHVKLLTGHQALSLRQVYEATRSALPA